MKRRALKIVTLAAMGGVLFQLSSCALIIGQLFLQNAVTTVLSAIVSGLLGNTDAMNDTGNGG